MKTIQRALIIRRLSKQISLDYAYLCAESCELHSLPYEFINGIENLKCKDAYDAVKIKTQTDFNNFSPACCAHASHILCWRKIVEYDFPCIILEHDAVVLGDVMNIEIPDYTTVSFGNHVNNIDEYYPIGPAKKLTEIRRSKGVHAYAITPKTAKALLEEIETCGVDIGVDRKLMYYPTYPLYLCDPPQVVCWNRHSTIADDMNNHTRRIISNFHDMEIPSWKAGFRKLRPSE